LDDTPAWFDKLRATLPPCLRTTSPTGCMLNEDGGVMSLGKDGGKETYYCGQLKAPTSFIRLSSTFPHPPNDKCGPNDGMQCIACKVVQDMHMISETTPGNCHKVFARKFRQWIRDINATQTGNRHDFTEIEDEICVCNGRLNSSQASKTIFCTALEMIGAECVAAKLVLSCHIDLKLTLGGGSCVVEIQDPRTQNVMFIQIECNTQQTTKENIGEYNRVHTSCSFLVEYLNVVQDLSGEGQLLGVNECIRRGF
jgi:hypothetical protein